ncbi:MAG: SCP2 sterol-binding domain-containing protein [Pseudomonadota bacterium]
MADGGIDVLKTAAGAAFDAPFGAVLAIDCGDVGVFVDGTVAPPCIVETPPGAPDCAWRAAPDCVAEILSGRLCPAKAFLNGQLSVSGDMSIMARLDLAAIKNRSG